MKEVTFIRQNIEKWKRAETMVEQAESLSPDELADAYTELTADLAFAQTHFPASRITIYLNNLASALHNRIYRNKPTVHKVWDENTAILSGDAMLVLAYRLMNNCPERYLKQVMDIFSQTALEICEGQQWDMEFETRNDVTVPEYMEMIRLKTSVLLSAALKIGAVLGGASEDDARKLYDFGIKMGLAFQLQDDYLDVYGDSKVFGKNIGGDILCNKKTFMLINALALADGIQRKELEKWIASTAFCPEEKIKAVTALYDKIGIGGICEEKINAYYVEGLSLLESMAVPSERKEELKSFVCHLMNRKV